MRIKLLSLGVLCFMTSPAQGFMSAEQVNQHFKFGEKERAFKPKAGQVATRALASLEISASTEKSMSNELRLNSLPNDVDLRGFDTPIKDQIGGKCTAYSLSAVVENLLNSQGRTRNVSVAHLWSEYRIYDADAAIDAFSKKYITEAEYWPNHLAAPTQDISQHKNIRVSQFQNHQYDLQAALEALAQHHPVMMAVQVPKDMSNCKATIAANSRRTKGQHAIAAVGYHLDPQVAGGGYFIVKNSWTEKCGDQGYQYYPFALCKRKDLYCYFIEVSGVELRN